MSQAKKRTVARGVGRNNKFRAKPEGHEPINRPVAKPVANLNERALEEKSAWLRRPRVPSDIFREVMEAAELDAVLAEHGFRQNAEVRAKQKQKQWQKIASAIGDLDWPLERLELFTRRILAYDSEPSIGNYLRVRREFPEVEIEVGRFGGIEALIQLQKEFERQGVNPHLVAAALDVDEAGVDALCLHLLELVAARDSLPKSGPGYIEKRRCAISDATLNYLIITILEAYERYGNACRVPASLVVLTRHLLCGSLPNLEMEARSREFRNGVAIMVGKQLKPGERLSINNLKKLTGLPRTTAARWLADPEFKSRLEETQKLAAEGVFEGGWRAAIRRLLSRGCPTEKRVRDTP